MLILLVICHVVCTRHGVTNMTRSFVRRGADNIANEIRRLRDVRLVMDCLQQQPTPAFSLFMTVGDADTPWHPQFFRPVNLESQR